MTTETPEVTDELKCQFILGILQMNAQGVEATDEDGRVLTVSEKGIEFFLAHATEEQKTELTGIIGEV